MKARNLIIVLTSDQVREAKAYLEQQWGLHPAPGSPAGRILPVLLKALREVRDGGNLEGTPYYADPAPVDIEETAPVAAQEAQHAEQAPDPVPAADRVPEALPKPPVKAARA